MKRTIIVFISIIFLIKIYFYIKFPFYETDNLDFINYANAFKNIIFGNFHENPLLFYWVSPLYPIILSLFAIINIKLIIAQRVLAFMLDIGTLYFFYKYNEKLFPKVKWLSLLLYSLSPILIYSTHMAISGSLYLFLFSTFLYFVYSKPDSILCSFIVSCLYLTRPEGIFYIPVYGYFLFRGSKKLKYLYLSILFIIPYMAFLWSFSDDPTISIKSRIFIKEANLYYQKYIETGKDSPQFRSEFFDKGSWIFRDNNVINKSIEKNILKTPIFKSKETLVLTMKTYIFWLIEIIKYYFYMQPLFYIFLIFAGIFISDKKLIIQQSIFLLPIITYPLASFWTKVDSNEVRHFMFLELLIIPYVSNYLLLLYNIRLKKSILYIVFSSFLCFFFMSPYYFESMKANVYIINRIFEKELLKFNLKGKVLMSRDPWLPYTENSKWENIILFDDEFQKKLLELNVDYIALGQRYSYFFDHSLYFKNGIPKYLKQVYKKKIKGVECILYKVNKNLL